MALAAASGPLGIQIPGLPAMSPRAPLPRAVSRVPGGQVQRRRLSSPVGAYRIA
jgi:hypothetical protein